MADSSEAPVVTEEVQTTEEELSVANTDAGEGLVAHAEENGDTMIEAETTAEIPEAAEGDVVPNGDGQDVGEGEESAAPDEAVAEGKSDPAGDGDSVAAAGSAPVSFAGCEIFIGGLHESLSDEELRKVLEPFGEVHEIRRTKDRQTNQWKRFGFICFKTKQAAKNAVSKLNETNVKGRRVRVVLSDAKNRLFVGNIPKEISKDDLLAALKTRGEGITNVDLLTDPDDAKKNRGFTFVEYESHLLAERARRRMTEREFLIGGRPVNVNWADPRSEPDEEIMEQVKALYVRNLAESVTDEILKTAFEVYGPVSQVLLVGNRPGQKRRDFGFVHFAEREHALAAMEGMNNQTLEGRAIEVTLAKPPMEKKPDRERQLSMRGRPASGRGDYGPGPARAMLQGRGPYPGYGPGDRGMMGYMPVPAYAPPAPVMMQRNAYGGSGYGMQQFPRGPYMQQPIVPMGGAGYARGGRGGYVNQRYRPY